MKMHITDRVVGKELDYLRDSVLETGALIERGAEVLDSVLLPGAAVRAGARLRRVVLGHSAVVEPGAVWEEALLTVARDGTASLVRTPLGA